jgi:hypothetical protein
MYTMGVVRQSGPLPNRLLVVRPRSRNHQLKLLLLQAVLNLRALI